MRERLEKGLIVATTEVFDGLLSMEAIAGDRTVTTTLGPMGGLTGMIWISGAISGWICVVCTEALALEMAQRMLGDASRGDSAELRDVVGELTNMITGAAKRQLSPEKSLFDLSVPTVISGAEFTTGSFPPGEFVGNGYACDGHQFQVLMSIDERGDTPKTGDRG